MKTLMCKKHLVHKIIYCLIVVGALNWGLIETLEFDLVKYIGDNTNTDVAHYLYIIIGFAALLSLIDLILKHKKYDLPFLGEAVYPCGSLIERIPENADTTVKINVEPNVNVIYWAADTSGNSTQSPLIAYSQYANAGVTVSNSSGVASLSVRKPSQYQVFGKKLPLHIHYRVCESPGMMSAVKTINI
jgi:uncharacterized membrane protein YuzA (DUF378 family)